MALRTNFLAVLTKSPLRTGGVNVMAGQGKGGTLLIEQQECGYSGVVALFARPFYALGAFQRGSANITKHQKLAFIGGFCWFVPVNNLLPCLCQSRRERVTLNLYQGLKATKSTFIIVKICKK